MNRNLKIVQGMGGVGGAPGITAIGGGGGGIGNLPLREPSIFEKTTWLCGELLDLSARFREQTIKLDAARAAQSMEGMRAAYLDIQTISDQITALHPSMETAIANETKRREQ